MKKSQGKHAWDALNNVDNNSTNSDSESESIRDFGEVIATFDILWKRGACDEGGPDGQWNGEQITIRRFDPFVLADADELDAARSDGRPLKEIYRAYFLYGVSWRGTYSKYPSIPIPYPVDVLASVR
jgi:hypothetical protein